MNKKTLDIAVNKARKVGEIHAYNEIMKYLIENFDKNNLKLVEYLAQKQIEMEKGLK